MFWIIIIADVIWNKKVSMACLTGHLTVWVGVGRVWRWHMLIAHNCPNRSQDFFSPKREIEFHLQPNCKSSRGARTLQTTLLYTRELRSLCPFPAFHRAIAQIVNHGNISMSRFVDPPVPETRGIQECLFLWQSCNTLQQGTTQC